MTSQSTEAISSRIDASRSTSFDDPSFFTSSLQPEIASIILAPSSTSTSSTTTTEHFTHNSYIIETKKDLTNTDVSTSPSFNAPASTSFSFALSPFLPLAESSSSVSDSSSPHFTASKSDPRLATQSSSTSNSSSSSDNINQQSESSQTTDPSILASPLGKSKRRIRRKRVSATSSAAGFPSSSSSSLSAPESLLAPFSRMAESGVLPAVPSSDSAAWEVVPTPRFISPPHLQLESTPSFLRTTSSPLCDIVPCSSSSSSQSFCGSYARDIFSPSTSSSTFTPSFAFTINSSTSALDAASRAMQSAMSASAAAVAASKAAGAATLALLKIEERLHPSSTPSFNASLPTPSVATAAAVALVVPSLLVKAMSMASELASSLVIVGSSNGSTAVVTSSGSQPLFGTDLVTPMNKNSSLNLLTPMSARRRGGGSRVQYRQIPEVKDDYVFDEDMICYCFEQLFDHMNTAKDFFEFEEKEKTIHETDLILFARFEAAKKKREECERLVKRFIYLYIDVAGLTVHERVVRLNCVWPVVMMLTITWEEKISWDYPVESDRLTEEQRSAKAVRVQGECDVEFRRGPIEMSVLLLMHLTRQIRQQLAEIFPLISSLQNDDEEVIIDFLREEEKQIVAVMDEAKLNEGDSVRHNSLPLPVAISRPSTNDSGAAAAAASCSFARRNSVQEESEEDDEGENKMCEPWWKSSAFFLGGWLAVWLKLTRSEKEEVRKEEARVSQSHPLSRHSQCGGRPSQNNGRLSQSQSEPGPFLSHVPPQREGLTQSASMRSLPDVSSRRSSFSAVPVNKKVSAETVYNSVSSACELLKTLTTAPSCGPVDPFLREAIFVLFHPPVFDYLRCRVNPESITSQQAVNVVRLLNQYERLLGSCVTIRSKDLYLQDLVDIVNMYMDAYDRYTKDKLCNLAKNIHLREISEASCTEMECCSHTHGPLDLFTLIDDNLDIAIEEHYLGAKALLRLYTTFARVFSYFQSLQLRTLCATRVSATVSDIHDPSMVEITHISPTQTATLQWLHAQANNAALYQNDTRNLLDKCLKLLSSEDVRERQMTVATMQHVSDGFHNVGLRVADVIAEIAVKYVQKSLDVCFTSEWFENHELTMDEIHGTDRDLDAIVSRVLRGLSDVHVAHITFRIAHGLVSHYFNFFVRHLADKKLSEINEDRKLWVRIQEDKENFLEFFQQFHEFIDEKQFEEELEWLDRLQQLGECDTDMLTMLVLKSRLDERFRVDPVIDTNTVLEGVLSLRDDLKPGQVTEALDLKVDAVEAEDKSSGIEINVERGQNLAIKDAFSSDPFVKIILIGAGGKRLFDCATHVIKNNLNPVWHYTCSNYHSDLLAHADKIMFECWDWDLIGHGDFMGCAFMDMFEIKHNTSMLKEEAYTVTLDLQPSAEYNEDVKGTITVSFRYWIKHSGSAELHTHSHEAPYALAEVRGEVGRSI